MDRKNPQDSVSYLKRRIVSSGRRSLKSKNTSGKGHVWNGCANWVRDDYQICKGCGGEFHRTHIRQVYCNVKCRIKRLTPEQKIIVERFKNVCRKYDLTAARTFAIICHTTPDKFYRLLHKSYALGQQRFNRQIMVMGKFCEDMENGWYDLVDGKYHWQRRKFYFAVKRRETRVIKNCPRKRPGCTGGLTQGTCPINFRECEFK